MTVSRRGAARFLGLGLCLLGLPRWALAQSPPSDRGIGGTGAAPIPGEDRGTGGTGVIGTICRLDSIVVNGLQIAYGEDVAVEVDGEPAPPSALRLGHVVRVAAFPDKWGGLRTGRIVVANEVVGPVDHRGPDHLVVLGQTVVLDDALKSLRWNRGVHVAVSGLRRPDGVIVASLIEPARPRHQRLSGTLVQNGPDGLRIGRLALRGVDPAYAGQRVTVEGLRRGGVFHARTAVPERTLFKALGTERLSLETYVARSGDRVSTASGLAADAAATSPALPENAVERAVVSATVRPGGEIVVDHIDVMSRDGHGLGGLGRGRNGGASPGPAKARPAAAPSASGSPMAGGGPAASNPAAPPPGAGSGGSDVGRGRGRRGMTGRR